MALQNTSDRYKYIYGNNARKLEEDYAARSHAAQPERAPAEGDPAFERPVKQKVPARKAAAHKKSAGLAGFDGKYTVITVVAIVCCVIASLFYVGGTVRLHALSTEVSELKTEKTKLQSRQTALQTEIDKNINLEEIRTFAEEELNMVYPGSDQVIYYNSGSGDYFRQYESVNAAD